MLDDDETVLPEPDMKNDKTVLPQRDMKKHEFCGNVLWTMGSDKKNHLVCCESCPRVFTKHVTGRKSAMRNSRVAKASHVTIVLCLSIPNVKFLTLKILESTNLRWEIRLLGVMVKGIIKQSLKQSNLEREEC